jgi:hypothetical protein
MLTSETKIAPELLPCLPEMVRYLADTGWEEIKQKDADLRVFGTLRFNGDGTFIKLPSDASAWDTKLLILRSIQQIAVERDVDEFEILHEVFRYDCDVLQQRIIVQDPQNSLSHIPLIMLQEYLKNMIDVIGNAVYFETLLENTPNYSFCTFHRARDKSETAKEVAKKAFFGHTFNGSFGLAIEMPVFNTTDCSAGDSPMNRDRRVMERLAVGFDDTALAVSANNGGNEIVQNYKKGFDMDMCDSLCLALESLAVIGNPELEFSFKWSPAMTSKPAILALKPTRLSPEKAISVIRSAVKRMKEMENSAALSQEAMLKEKATLESFTQ